MRCTPGDPCGIHAPAGNLLRAIVVALPRLVIWHRPRWPRLCQLTGTRSQQAAIVLAVRPVVRELLPGLEAAGLEVGSIVLLPTLAGSAGEPLQAQVEQETSTRSYLIRLAHMVGGMLRRPEQVAGALAEELLGLYRDAGAVTHRAANAGCHPGDGRHRIGGGQEEWPLVGGAPAARSGEKRSRGDRCSLQGKSPRPCHQRPGRLGLVVKLRWTVAPVHLSTDRNPPSRGPATTPGVSAVLVTGS
jgi:hypothetical protein